MALNLTNPQFKALTKNPQRKTYTIVVATIVLIILLLFSAIRPAVTSVFDKTSSNSVKREVLADMDHKYESLVSLGGEADTRADSIAILHHSLPDGREEEIIIVNINNFVRLYDLDLNSMYIDKEIKKSVLGNSNLGPKVKVAGITIEVEGDRDSVNQFVEKLEKFPRIINIHSLTMSPVGGLSRDSNDVHVNIQAETYYMQQDAQIVD